VVTAVLAVLLAVVEEPPVDFGGKSPLLPPHPAVPKARIGTAASNAKAPAPRRLPEKVLVERTPEGECSVEVRLVRESAVRLLFR
jgi:hypothetical protein